MAKAIDKINEMLSYRLSSDKEAVTDDGGSPADVEARGKVGCKIFLACSSNMISCGLREVIRYLVQHKLIDVMVTTAGGIEEDFIKCMSDFYLGKFNMDGRQLRER